MLKESHGNGNYLQIYIVQYYIYCCQDFFLKAQSIYKKICNKRQYFI